jgi:2,3-bisphosphoglycerate-independent phosphoglycerate mutase
MLGGALPTLANPVVEGARAVAFPLDATLGVDGTPQSGTGQTTLLTGKNGPQLYGRHFGPWVPVRLRPLVEEESVLRAVQSRGGRVAFANAYPRGWPGPKGGRRLAGPPLAARGAGLLTRHEEELGRGEAVSSEIVNDGWRDHLGHDWLPEVSAEQAGAILGAIAEANDLTLFAHYATDTAGHRGGMPGAVASLERVDAFLGGLLASVGPHMTVLLISDHGNIEDVRGGHTRNPSLAVASGPGADRARQMSDLSDVSSYVLEAVTGS